MNSKWCGVAVAACLLGGPAAARAGYIAGPAAYQFEDITGTGTRTLVGFDDVNTPFELANPFNFYGTSYSTLYLSTNGLISFGGGNSGFVNTDLSASGNTAGRPTIAAFWDDLVTFGNNATSYGVYAQSFADRTIVQWEVDGYFSSPSSASFQAVLYDTGDVRFNYRDVTFGDSRDRGAGATVGVRDSDGQFTQLLHDQPLLADNTSYLFSAAVMPTPAPSTAALVLIGAAGWGGRRVGRGRVGAARG